VLGLERENERTPTTARALAGGSLQHLAAGLCRPHTERFLAQNRLARLEGALGPVAWQELGRRRRRRLYRRVDHGVIALHGLFDSVVAGERVQPVRRHGWRRAPPGRLPLPGGLVGNCLLANLGRPQNAQRTSPVIFSALMNNSHPCRQAVGPDANKP